MFLRLWEIIERDGRVRVTRIIAVTGSLPLLELGACGSLVLDCSTSCEEVFRGGDDAFTTTDERYSLWEIFRENV